MLKTYSVSLAAGMLAGLIYAALGVHSPAPPIVALLGLFGMQVGEHLIPLVKSVRRRQPVNLRWFRHEYQHKIGDTPPPSGDKAS